MHAPIWVFELKVSFSYTIFDESLIYFTFNVEFLTFIDVEK